MSAQCDQVKVLEQCQISSPPNSVPTTSFPFTFMDIHWLFCCPAQAAFLYKTPFSIAQFTGEILPQLKNSLSLALQWFFPLCGNFVCPPQPSEPYILYKDGDSVPLLVAYSTGAFSDFLRYGPKDAKVIHMLMPPTPPKRVVDDTLEELMPLLSVQVTLFPNSGLCIGITHRHVVADGMSFFHFVKTWASICKANCDMSNVSISLPIHDKSFIQDPDGIKNVRLKQWREQGSPTWDDTIAPAEDIVRATFTLSRSEIEQLKKWVSAKCYNGTDTMPKKHWSSFVVTSVFVWVCMIKSLNLITTDLSKDGELCHFALVADCRNKYDLGIPATFFGNCISGKLVSVARSKFREEDCVATVAEAIRHCVESFKEVPLDGHPNEYSKWGEVMAKGENIFSISGSPKLAAYEIDFCWGRPEKFESVHISISGSIALFESRNEKGGIEVGLCRSRHEMEVFTSIFEAGKLQFLGL